MKKKILFVCFLMVITVFLPRIANAQSGCTPVTITSTTPFTEDFEGYTGTASYTDGVIPTCWDRYSTSTVAPHIANSGDHHYHSENGTNSLFFYGEGAGYVVLPEFTNPLNELQISLWRQMESNDVGTLTVGYITDGDVNMSTFTAVATVANFPYGETSTYTLNRVPATAKRIVLKWDYPTNYSCCVDDITVSLLPPCPIVGNFTATNVSHIAADINWTPGSTETYWELRYRKADGTSYWRSANFSNTNPTHRLTYLEANTRYEVQVQAQCSNTLYGDWSESFFFTTQPEPTCADIEIPYEEGFENSSTGLLPDCWRSLLSYNHEYPAIGSNPTSNAHRGSYYLYMWSPNSSHANAFYLPPIAATYPLNTLQVQFYAKCSSYEHETPSFEVGVIEMVDGTPTFVNVQNVDLSESYQAYSNTPYVVSFAGYTGTSQTIAFRVSSSDDNSSYTYMDDITVKVISNCARVGEVTASEVASSSAVLTWAPALDETRWQMQVAAYNASTNTWGDYVMLDTLIQASPFTLTGLDELTQYRVQVRAYCGTGDYGEWNTRPATFTTIQTPVVVNAAYPLYTDDFESGNNWVLVNGTQPNAWTLGTATHNGGSHSLYISSDGGTSNIYTNHRNTVYATKVFSLEANEYNVQYDWKAYGEQGYDHMRVFLVPADISIIATTQTSLIYTTGVPSVWSGAFAIDGNTQLNLSNTWKTLTSTVNVPTSGNYMVVFSWQNDNNPPANPPAAVDNFSIQYVSCTAPTDLQAGEITTSSATLTWTAPASASSATTYNVRYGVASDFDLEDAGTYTEVTNVTSPLEVTGLFHSTVYTFSVQTVCSSDDASRWVNPSTFTTQCGTFNTFPWTENFDGLTVDRSIPLCWDNSEGTTDNASYVWGYSTYNNGNTHGTGHSGNCVRFNSYANSTGKTNVLKTPVLGLPADKGSMLSFWYKNPKGGDLTVMLLDATDGTQLAELATGLTNQPEWTEFTADLSDYGGSSVKIAFKGTSNYGNGDAFIYLDDVSVEEFFICKAPTDVTASNVTEQTADIAWTGASAAADYKVRYREVSEDVETDWQTTTSTESPVTLNNLSSNSTYEVQVMTNCSGEDNSEWSSPVQFTTLPCPVPTDVTVSNVTTQTADVAWTGTAGSYNVRYRVATSEEVIFFEDFENGLDNWTVHTQGTAPEANGWYLFDMGHHWFYDYVPSLYNVASSWSNIGDDSYNADNWLVSPQLEMGNLLRFWVRDNHDFPDKYGVYLSTTGNNVADFTTELKPVAYGPGDWTEIRVDLTPYAGQTGYIAIRHLHTGGNYLFVDNFAVSNETVSEWQNLTMATNAVSLSGLNTATQYEFQVQSDCGDDQSEWVSQTFSTQYCEEEDKCDITIELTNTGGDGWPVGNRMNVLDARTFELLGIIVNTSDAVQGEAQSHTLAVCDGRQIAFVWDSFFGYDETSYSIKDPEGVIIRAGNAGFEDTVYYTMSCPVVCETPVDLTISEIGINSAVLSWTGTAADYNVQYKATTATEWQTVANTTSPMTLSGLLAETEYEVQVQSVCGTNTSQWSAPDTFKTYAPCPDVQDYDDNNYTSVRLGGKCWMTSNLRTTHYADGREVSNVLKYQSPENPDAEANAALYGLLYDWYDALDVERPTKGTQVQGICPAEWRMPNEEDFAALSANDVNTLRSTNLWITNPGSNATGFNMLPSGQFNPDKNRYENLLGNAYFWSADSSSETMAHAHMADCHCYMWYDFVTLKNYGFSVRCVKD